MTQDLWDALQSTVVTYLRTVTLHSLAAEQMAKGFQADERKVVPKGCSEATPLRWPARYTNSVFALARGLG
ncbi:hypothetical protein [Candidatus Aalborgicola defluviihabitans]|uniref:hypothetical protein n=1 Tax=Candidatus Aalborgicola defluviihabitans TaxID=3386187 RepID=UPI0039B8572B